MPIVAAMRAYDLDWNEIGALPAISQGGEKRDEKEGRGEDEARYVSVQGAQELGRKLGKNRGVENVEYRDGETLGTDVGIADIRRRRIRYGTLYGRLRLSAPLDRLLAPLSLLTSLIGIDSAVGNKSYLEGIRGQR